MRAKVALLLTLSMLSTHALAQEDAPAEEASTVRQANNGNITLDGIPELPEGWSERVRRYRQVRGARAMTWSEDGSELYIRTRFGETSQLHRLSMPMGARHQVTFFEERVGGAIARPGHDDLLISMDVGGAENYAQRLLGADGSVVTLTPTGRNTGPSFDAAGEHMVWTSTARNGSANDIWWAPVDRPEEAEVLYESQDGSWWGVVDWHPDETELLVLQYIRSEDSRLHRLSLEDRTLTPLLGDEDDPLSIDSAWYHPDGDSIFVLSDAHSDFKELGQLSLEDTGRRRRRRRQPLRPEQVSSFGWSVDQGALSRDRSHAALVTNENGFSQLYLHSAEDNQLRLIEGLPGGIYYALHFSPDGSRLAVTANTPSSPSDVYVVELGTEGGADRVVRWTESEIGGLDPSTFATAESFSYPTFDSVDGARRQIPAIIYRAPGDGPKPVIINIHGGPEAQSRPWFSSSIQLYTQELGATVIAPNVRGSSGYGQAYAQLDNGFLREDSVYDIGALLDWIAEQPDLDASRVAVTGGSYGGYMVLSSIMHYSERIACGVDVVGISNFVTFLENTADYRRDLRRVEYGDERDLEMRAFQERISPALRADELGSPLLIMQGANDPRVPASEAEQMVRELRALDRDVWYFLAHNEGHGFARKENADLSTEVQSWFLSQCLSEAP